MSKEFNFSLDEEKKRLEELENVSLQTAAQHNSVMGRLHETKERIARIVKLMEDAAKATLAPVGDNSAATDAPAVAPVELAAAPDTSSTPPTEQSANG